MCFCVDRLFLSEEFPPVNNGAALQIDNGGNKRLNKRQLGVTKKKDNAKQKVLHGSSAVACGHIGCSMGSC